jgi:hypothetical protein
MEKEFVSCLGVTMPFTLNASSRGLPRDRDAALCVRVLFYQMNISVIEDLEQIPGGIIANAVIVVSGHHDQTTPVVDESKPLLELDDYISTAYTP